MAEGPDKSAVHSVYPRWPVGLFRSRVVPRGIEQAGIEGNGRCEVTGWREGVFFIGGTASKKLVEWAEMRELVKFPSRVHRNHCLGPGAKPASLFDGLPNDPAEESPEVKA